VHLPANSILDAIADSPQSLHNSAAREHIKHTPAHLNITVQKLPLIPMLPSDLIYSKTGVSIPKENTQIEMFKNDEAKKA